MNSKNIILSVELMSETEVKYNDTRKAALSALDLLEFLEAKGSEKAKKAAEELFYILAKEEKHLELKLGL